MEIVTENIFSYFSLQDRFDSWKNKPPPPRPKTRNFVDATFTRDIDDMSFMRYRNVFCLSIRSFSHSSVQHEQNHVGFLCAFIQFAGTSCALCAPALYCYLRRENKKWWGDCQTLCCTHAHDPDSCTCGHANAAALLSKGLWTVRWALFLEFDELNLCDFFS